MWWGRERLDVLIWRVGLDRLVWEGGAGRLVALSKVTGDVPLLVTVCLNWPTMQKVRFAGTLSIMELSYWGDVFLISTAPTTNQLSCTVRIIPWPCTVNDYRSAANAPNGQLKPIISTRVPFPASSFHKKRLGA